MGFNFFGINIPTPSLPRFSVPSLPRISIPKVSVPQIRLPSLPRISIPKVSIPSLPTLPKIGVPSLPRVNLPSVPDVSRHIDTAQKAVSDLNLAAQGILPTGMRVGTKAYDSWIEETTKRAQWAAEAAQEAAANVARSAPKVELPKVSLPTLPKVSLPDISKVSLPSVPRVALPDVSKVSLPTLPGVNLSEAAGAIGGLAAGASAPAVLGNALSKVSLPDVSKVSLPTLPSLPQGEGGGKNILDAVIDARDQTYEQGAENIAGGNAALGVGQFGGAAAADVLLPLDAVNVANKLATGRGGELTTEDYLWAGIDAISLAAAPFTFGASYAAARAAKAAKVAGKTAKVGETMAKSKSIGKGVSAVEEMMRGGRKMSSASMSAYRPVRAVAGRDVRSIDRLRVQMQNQKATWAAALRRQQDAARKQYEAAMRWRKTPQKAPSPAPSKVAGADDALGAVAKTESKTESVWGKAGKVLKYMGIGLGAGAIGLTALNALGGPAPQSEVPPVTDPYYDPYGPLPGGDLLPPWPGGGDLPWWGDEDLPGAGDDIGGAIGPYYPPDDYYDPAYPDPLGLEDYAQDICSYAEGIPGVGGVFGAARESGMALPVLLIAGVVVVGGGVLFLKKTKTGKKITAKVGEAVDGAKKAVGA